MATPTSNPWHDSAIGFLDRHTAAAKVRKEKRKETFQKASQAASDSANYLASSAAYGANSAATFANQNVVQPTAKGIQYSATRVDTALGNVPSKVGQRIGEGAVLTASAIGTAASTAANATGEGLVYAFQNSDYKQFVVIFFVLLLLYFIYFFQTYMDTWQKKLIGSVVIIVGLILFMVAGFKYVAHFTNYHEIFSVIIDNQITNYLPLLIIIFMVLFSMSGSNIVNNQTELGTNIMLYLITIFTVAYVGNNYRKDFLKAKQENYEKANKAATTNSAAENTLSFFDQLTNTLSGSLPAVNTLNFFKNVTDTAAKTKAGVAADPDSVPFLEEEEKKNIVLCLGYFFAFLYFLLSLFLPSKYSGSFKSTTQVLLFLFSMMIFLYTLLYNKTFWPGTVGLCFSIFLFTFLYFYPMWFLKNTLNFFIAFVVITAVTGFAYAFKKTDKTKIYEDVKGKIGEKYSKFKEEAPTAVKNYLFSLDRLPMFIFFLVVFLIVLICGVTTKITSTEEKLWNCFWQLLVIGIFAWIVSFLSFQNEKNLIFSKALWNSKFVIGYVVFLILFFNIIEKDTLNKYAYMWVPSLVCLGASVFYTSIEGKKNAPSNLLPTKQMNNMQRNLGIPNPRKYLQRGGADGDDDDNNKKTTAPKNTKNNNNGNNGNNNNNNNNNNNKNSNFDRIKDLIALGDPNDPEIKKMRQMLFNQQMKNFTKSTDKNLYTNDRVKFAYERLKTIIVFFCLIATMFIFYVVDPAGYFSKYLGPNFIYTIFLGVFAFMFMTILSSYPQTILKQKTVTKEWNMVNGRIDLVDKKKEEKIPMDKRTLSTSLADNLFDSFNSVTVISTIFFVLFIIIVTIYMTTYKDGFMESNPYSGLIVVIVIIVILLWGGVLGMQLFSTDSQKKTNANNNDPNQKKTKEEKDREEKQQSDQFIELLMKIGLVFSGGLFLVFFVVFIVKFFTDVSSTANVYQLIFNLLFLIFYGFLCIKNVLPEMNLPFISNYRLGKTSAIFVGLMVVSALLSKFTGSSFPLKLFFTMAVALGTAMYLGVQSIFIFAFAAFFSVWIAYYFGFMNELKHMPWYLMFGFYALIFVFCGALLLRMTNDVPGSSFYVYLSIISIALLLFYTFIPTIKEKIAMGKSGKQLTTNPIALDKNMAISTYEELNGNSTSTYMFALSFWFYVDADAPKSYVYSSILNYGDKPNIAFNLHETSLRITMKTGGPCPLAQTSDSDKPTATTDADPTSVFVSSDEYDTENNRILYTGKNILLQKWNHLFINFDGGTMDIFLNGELVQSAEAVVPCITQDSLTIGEENGLAGQICNLVYYTQPQPVTTILYLYNSMRYTDPPVPKEHNQLVDVGNIDAGEKIIRYT
jgi:hypothetical protein